MNDLALQVGQIDDIVVDHADGADAGGCEIEQQRRAEPARADHQNAAFQQLGLADAAHFRQHDMPRVAVKLFFGVVHAP